MRKYSDVVPGKLRRKTLPDVSTASIAVPTCAVVTSVGVTQPSRMRDQALMWAGLEPAGAEGHDVPNAGPGRRSVRVVEVRQPEVVAEFMGDGADHEVLALHRVAVH